MTTIIRLFIRLVFATILLVGLGAAFTGNLRTASAANENPGLSDRG